MGDEWLDEYYWLDDAGDFPNDRSDPAIWDRDRRSEEFARQLLANPTTARPAGLEVTDLPFAFGFTSALEDPRLITRTNTRAVYTAVFNMIMNNPLAKRILVEGAPGIGKSRNLTYLLKLLLGRNRKVIYHCAMERTVYVFVPPQALLEVIPGPTTVMHANRYRCYSTTEASFFSMPDQNLTRNTTTVYLFDPSHDAGEPPQVDCFVVIAASPNVKHFSDFIKGGSAKLFKINRFSLEEVIFFYATLYPPPLQLSGTTPVGDEDTFATRLGPIRSAEDNLPLCENHLRYGFYEVRYDNFYCEACFVRHIIPLL